MNKWRKRARIEKADRKHFQADLVVLRRSSVVMHKALKGYEAKLNEMSEREAAALNKAEELRLAADRWQKTYQGEHDCCTEALNKVDELHRDAARLATELARVQGVCEGTQEELSCALARSERELARVQGVCDDTQARLVSLQESDMLDLLEKKRLLAWQRGVREALGRGVLHSITRPFDIPDGAREFVCLRDCDYIKLRQAIEGDEPKGETP